jgi:hypothetical protein
MEKCLKRVEMKERYHRKRLKKERGNFFQKKDLEQLIPKGIIVNKFAQARDKDSNSK